MRGFGRDFAKADISRLPGLSLQRDQRPPISADLRRRVLVEAGHRCAIPTCRYIEVDVHHIIPWSRARIHEYENLIALCPNCHRRADRGEIDRKALRLYKRNLRFVHDKYSQLEMDMMFELARAPEHARAPWMPFMMIFFKRALDSEYVAVQSTQGGVFMGGVPASPDFLVLTAKGRDFVRELETGAIDEETKV